MAGIDVGGHGGKRPSNHEVPLIPFIDFLLCLVMFLLVTAVWSHMARLEADSKVPAPSKQIDDTPPKPEKKMHIDVKSDSFSVYWTVGGSSQPIAQFTVPRNDSAAKIGKNEDLVYKDLGTKILESWKEQGQHNKKEDKKFDQCVIQVPNDSEFRVITGVIDAIYTAKREDPEKPNSKDKVPALKINFAM